MCSSTIQINRFAYSDKFGVFGEMDIAGTRLVTVERPWLDNKPNVSCIPVGKYKVVPRWYNRGGYAAMEVIDVPSRSHILFHIGNTLHDSAGCILVTSQEGCIGGIWGGTGSTTAFNYFMEKVGGIEHTLIISGEINHEA